MINSSNPFIIIFNEMFFGRDNAINKNSVHEIIDVYNRFQEFFKNTYLFVNFLYKDAMNEMYVEQVEISKKRYQQIKQFEKDNPSFRGFSSIWFNIGHYPPNYTSYNLRYLNLLLSGSDISKEPFENVLLFNQTKIFSQGKEIGFYNKSSFCGESLTDFIFRDSFKAKVPFYVIGDFQIHWEVEHDSRLDQITNLICYDTDALLNLPISYPPKKLCLFMSNTYNTLFESVSDRYKKYRVFDSVYICADPKGVTVPKTGTYELNRLELTGAFKPACKVFPIKAFAPNFHYDFSFPSKESEVNRYSIRGFQITDVDLN